MEPMVTEEVIVSQEIKQISNYGWNNNDLITLSN